MSPDFVDGHSSIRYDVVIHGFARGRQWAGDLPGACRFYAFGKLLYGITQSQLKSCNAQTIMSLGFADGHLSIRYDLVIHGLARGRQ